MSARGEQRSIAPNRLWPFRPRNDVVTVLDVGAYKVGCAIACLSAPRFGLDVGAKNIRILGSATVRSSGFVSGRIANLIAMESTVRRAVAQAEAQARIIAEEVIVTGQFHGLAAEIFEAKLGGHGIPFREDIREIKAAAEAHCTSEQRKLLHIFTSAAESEERPLPRGAPQRKMDVIAISIPIAGARQIAACLAHGVLSVRDYIAGPIATALAVTNPLERSAGVLVVDIGAQTTGIALFSRGVPVFLDSVDYGGKQITEAIAHTFGVGQFEAERLKIRYGSVFDGLAADIDLPVMRGTHTEPISKFSFNQLIRSKASSIFLAINERLKGAGYSIPTAGVVLAGGGSLLPGIRELAAHLLGAEAKTAKPMLLNGLTAATGMSAVVGACLYASRHQSPGKSAYTPEIASQDSSYASRISQWLRAGF